MSENLTTEDVREGFLLALTGMLPLIPGAEMIIKADFDAWLAEELRAVAELHAHNSTLNQGCAECVSSDHGYECTTNATIQAALGIDGKENTK